MKTGASATPFGRFMHRLVYGRRRVDVISEPMQTALIGRVLDRARLARIADALVVAMAISLPWSTSVTSILIVLWLLALAPTLDAAALRRAVDTPAWQQNRQRLAWALAALALVFLGNIVFVATSRASVVVFVSLVVVMSLQRFGWKGALGMMTGSFILALIAWNSSPYLRARITAVAEEIERYETERAVTSSGYRLLWWKQSLEFIAAAPVLGHGTGATREMFRRAAVNDPTLKEAITDNPHNQTLLVAIELGLIGAGLLYAMWIAHFLLFRGTGLLAWIGAGLVVQNVVGSLFNSQIFYFTPGWLYVVGVGVLGGMALAKGGSVGRPPTW